MRKEVQNPLKTVIKQSGDSKAPPIHVRPTWQSTTWARRPRNRKIMGMKGNTVTRGKKRRKYYWILTFEEFTQRPFNSCLNHHPSLTTISTKILTLFSYPSVYFKLAELAISQKQAIHIRALWAYNKQGNTEVPKLLSLNIPSLSREITQTYILPSSFLILTDIKLSTIYWSAGTKLQLLFPRSCAHTNPAKRRCNEGNTKQKYAVICKTRAESSSSHPLPRGGTGWTWGALGQARPPPATQPHLHAETSSKGSLWRLLHSKTHSKAITQLEKKPNSFQSVRDKNQNFCLLYPELDFTSPCIPSPSLCSSGLLLLATSSQQCG